MDNFYTATSGPEYSGEDGAKEQACERDRFLDLEELQFLSTEGIDKYGQRILRVVGKFLPAPIIDRSRLKDYLLFKLSTEIPQESFCIVYLHAQAKLADNCPGLLNLRWIYENVPEDFRQRLEAVYFVHPGILSRMIMGTVGRFLSNGLFDKVKYINRLEFLWDTVRRGQVEIPDFVVEHDNALEARPLMDYWIESDPFNTLSSSNMGHAKLSRWATTM